MAHLIRSLDKPEVNTLVPILSFLKPYILFSLPGLLHSLPHEVLGYMPPRTARKVIPPPIEPPHSKRGYSHASEWSDDETASDDDFGYGSEDDEERQARKGDMYLPKREREIRRSERIRMKKRERRRRMRESELKNGENREAWEIHFVPATPTIWQPGARPRTYGEPVVRLKR